MAPPRAGDPSETQHGLSAHPGWLPALLVVPIALWALVVLLVGGNTEGHAIRRFYRDLGYATLVVLAVPYLQVWRRLSFRKRRAHMARTMRWHIAAAYLAFGLMVVHARGHLFRLPLTSLIVVLFAVVLFSGALGMLMQKTVFRLMPMALEQELGLEQLHAERQRLMDDADRLVANYSMLTAADIRDWRGFCAVLLDENSKINARIWNHKQFLHAPREIVQAVVANQTQPETKDVLLAALNGLLRSPKFCTAKDFDGLPLSDETAMLLRRPQKELTELEIERRNRLYLELACPEYIAPSAKPPAAVSRFFEEEVAGYLRSQFPSWDWIFQRSALEPISRNHYLRLQALVDRGHAGTIKQLWDWVERRRQMDLEYWLHRLARVWLWAHGPLAWPLLVLVLYHTVWAVYYGGIF
jgi:hypothetical protein